MFDSTTVIQECSDKPFGGKLISGTSHPVLSEGIARALGVELTPVKIKKMSGEIWVQIEENVRGIDCFIIQSPHKEVSNHIMELLIMADALKRASARTITAVIPCYAYAKQEKKTTGREAISAKLIANLMTVAGVTRVITVDLHAAAIQGFFDIPVDNLYAIEIFIRYLRQKSIPKNELVIISPDAGGVTRMRTVADIMGADLAIIFKRRPRHEQAEAMGIVGDVNGMIGVIFDDMVMTGGTLVEAGEKLMERGLKTLYGCITHPILSGDAHQILIDSPFKQLAFINTLPILQPNPKIVVLPGERLLAKAIYRNWANMSISELFDQHQTKAA